MDTLNKILLGIPWFGWVALVAILFSTVKAVIRMTHSHEERMARIRHGGEAIDGDDERDPR